MYESPITTMITDVTDNIAKQFAEQTENMVYQEVLNIGVHVDKEELEKALQYDRNQYENGYMDALLEIQQEIQELESAISSEGFYYCQACVLNIIGKHLGQKTRLSR